jgi:Zn-dependent protease
MLAMADFSPLFLAVLICWIFSVCVHEFAHALAAYLGGDTSVREKGYLGFNVFAYVDPVTSLLLPALFLLMGGLPLPGGAVRIEVHRLRGRHWPAIVSAAGPASNFVLFLILAAIVHPRTGLVDPHDAHPPMWAMLLGAITVLQLFAVLFNLLPVPPLDGFGIIEPYLPPEVAEKARSLGWGGLFVLYFLFWNDAVRDAFMDAVNAIMQRFGLPFETTWRFYNIALFGSSE